MVGRGREREDQTLFSQTGERGCQRGVGVASVVKDLAGLFWNSSGALHRFLARKGRLVISLCITSGIGVMSSWGVGNSEMKVQGGLRPGCHWNQEKRV